MEFSQDNTLWIGTMNGVVCSIPKNTNSVQEFFFTNDYAIINICINQNNSEVVFSNMNMSIFYYEINNKKLISTMKGKAVSVDNIGFDFTNRCLTTSFEHITHIWGPDGRLVKAMVPIKEASFTNGKGYILNTKFGTFIADKKNDRKNIGETYVWDIVTEKQILYFKSFESTCMILKDRKFIFDNGTEICIFDSKNQTNSKIILSHDDISCLVGCQNYILTGTVDGFLNILIYTDLGDEILALQRISDLYFKFK